MERVLRRGDDAKDSRLLHPHRGRLPAAAELGAIGPPPIPRIGAPHLVMLGARGGAAHFAEAHPLRKVRSESEQRRIERCDEARTLAFLLATV